MLAYILRRLLLIIPTLLGILLINFVIIQSAPGGPVDTMLAQLQGQAGSRLSSSASTENYAQNSKQGLDPELVAEVQALYGFDQPPATRFYNMLISYAQFDFGDSLFRDSPVVDLIAEKLPVSISLGLWSTLLIYLISIPLGVRKAQTHGSSFDVWTSSIIVLCYAIPGFLLAILLIVLFAGGSYWDIFPLRGLHSSHYQELGFIQQSLDYFWHLCLPLAAYTIGGFATLTMLTKNSFLDEINKNYVKTAQAKGLNSKQVLYGHVFRNGMLIIIAGFPGAFISMFFTGSLLIEVIFSLDGLGSLAFSAAISRDYPVIFGTLFIFTIISLITKLISDLVYVLVDPRIDFNKRD